MGICSSSMSITKKDIFMALHHCGIKEFQDAIMPVYISIPKLPEKLNAKFTSRNEAAMFLAHCFHETGGLKYMEELWARKNPEEARKAYWQDGEGGDPQKSYHGRGLLQLSWNYNYRDASKGLGLGDQLLYNPEMVCEENPDLCIDTAIWFWTEKVRGKSGLLENFYVSTKVINGGIENTPNCEKALRRYGFYCKIAKYLGVKEIAGNKEIN